MPMRKQKRMGGDAYMEKVSTWRFVLRRSKCLANNKSVENKAAVDAHWVCMITALVVSILFRFTWVFIHTRVGFCVALP